MGWCHIRGTYQIQVELFTYATKEDEEHVHTVVVDESVPREIKKSGLDMEVLGKAELNEPSEDSLEGQLLAIPAERSVWNSRAAMSLPDRLARNPSVRS